MIRPFKESVFVSIGETDFLDVLQEGKKGVELMSNSVSRTNYFKTVNILDSTGGKLLVNILKYYLEALSICPNNLR